MSSSVWAGEKQRRLLCRMPQVLQQGHKAAVLGEAGRWPGRPGCLMIFSFLVNTGKSAPGIPWTIMSTPCFLARASMPSLAIWVYRADQAERLSVVGLQLPDSLQHSRRRPGGWPL